MCISYSINTWLESWQPFHERDWKVSFAFLYYCSVSLSPGHRDYHVRSMDLSISSPAKCHIFIWFLPPLFPSLSSLCLWELKIQKKFKICLGSLHLGGMTLLILFRKLPLFSLAQLAICLSIPQFGSNWCIWCSFASNVWIIWCLMPLLLRYEVESGRASVSLWLIWGSSICYDGGSCVGSLLVWRPLYLGKFVCLCLLLYGIWETKD